MRTLGLQFFSFITLVSNACYSRLMDMMFRKQWNFTLYQCIRFTFRSFCYCRFIDVPIESCGHASPLRVALQATRPDVLVILLRHGANSSPVDGGISPTIALMDKLLEYEESGSYPYQLVSCLKILQLVVPYIELPYKVSFVWLENEPRLLWDYSVGNFPLNCNSIFMFPLCCSH